MTHEQLNQSIAPHVLRFVDDLEAYVKIAIQTAAQDMLNLLGSQIVVTAPAEQPVSEGPLTGRLRTQDGTHFLDISDGRVWRQGGRRDVLLRRARVAGIEVLL
jgi:hypothetical protein